MRISMLLVTLSLSLAGAALGQESSAINARIRSDMDRMRGERVSVTDETMKPGRDLDLVKIQKKDAELTELLNSVNIDTIFFLSALREKNAQLADRTPALPGIRV